MNHPESHFFDFTPQTLKAWCADHAMKPFRAKQILEWVYEKNVVDPAAMTNLSNTDRSILQQEMVFLSGPTVAHQRATDGTQKLLIEWPDDLDSAATNAAEAGVDHASRLPIIGQDMPYSDTARQTECVMIPAVDSTRRTACISSQVGCPVGCTFCATGIGGLDGNLSAGRIIEQVWRLNQLPRVERITNVVFMGMGEPLANFQPVMHAVSTIAAPWGLGISARKITVSTVGMHKAIEKMADELDLPVTLALSLHAPNDTLRRELIPWAEFTSIDQLVESCTKWFTKTGREITLEYILLGGVNDLPEHAEQLASVAKRLRANINLIRYNEVESLSFNRPQTEDVHRFQVILRERGANVHIRASRGRDIAAACGQLRHEQPSA
ncbi:MAG: 23S rRNA (adenine(2503)-C(2))-methyltransferase RlmN [Phycisphaerales bacterium]|nr:23S rRNA (adenine(2503)-C(2))-methyltransferase RlmN [Phycisphaerales bacterium]